MPRAHDSRRVYDFLVQALARPEEHPCLAKLVVQNTTGGLRCRTPAETVEEQLSDMQRRLARLEWLVCRNNQRRLAALECQNAVLAACLGKLLADRDTQQPVQATDKRRKRAYI